MLSRRNSNHDEFGGILRSDPSSYAVKDSRNSKEFVSMYQTIAETLVRLHQVPDTFWYGAMGAVIVVATTFQLRESFLIRAHAKA